MVEPTRARSISQLGKFLATADKQKAEALVVPQALCRSEDRLTLVSPAEISRIADDKSASKPPFTAQWIIERRYGLDFVVIAPVRYDPDTLR